MDSLIPVVVVDADPMNAWRGVIGEVIWVYENVGSDHHRFPIIEKNREVYEKLRLSTWPSLLPFGVQSVRLQISKRYVAPYPQDNESYLSKLPKFDDLLYNKPKRR